MNVKRIVFSLPALVLGIFICLFVLITGIIILMQSLNFSKAISYTAKIMMENAANEVQTELIKLFFPIRHNVTLSANLIQTGLISKDVQNLSTFTYEIVKAFPLVNGSFYADITGTQVYSARKTNNTIITDIQNRHLSAPLHETFQYDQNHKLQKQATSQQMTGDDPRNKVWFLAVKNARKPIWTDVFRFYDENQIGIVSAAPIFDHDQFMGAFGINVTLDRLYDFINKQKISVNGFSFVISGNNNLVVYPKNNTLFSSLHLQPNTVINLKDNNIPFINESLNEYLKTNDVVNLTYQNIEYLVFYQPIKNIAETKWLVGVIIPKSDLVGALQRSNLIIFIISILLLLLGIIFLYRLTTLIIKPINRLALEAEKMKDFEIGEELESNSQIKEVIALTASINNMKRGLKNFQKYVPKDLIQKLIVSGKDLAPGGQRQELVVLFTDIENFTTISETLDPYQFTLQLSQYFDTLSDIINDEMGTIDKYIGDTIMAFWGAPLIIKDPYKHAAIAALRCQKKIEELNQRWSKEDKPIFKTRIGIHAGYAIVGNVGSSKRLNYTAIGDAINIASSLENINKQYQTKIIVSEDVYEHLKNEFKLSPIDEVKVTGRSKPIRIYELVGLILH